MYAICNWIKPTHGLCDNITKINKDIVKTTALHIRTKYYTQILMLIIFLTLKLIAMIEIKTA